MSHARATRRAARDDDRAWLRLHIEAVWGVSLPPLTPGVADVTLADTGAQPPWALYLGELITTGKHIRIWRADVAAADRASLLAWGEAALAAADAIPASTPMPGVQCEVALRPAAPARETPDAAQRLTRPLQRDDPADYALLATFIGAYDGIADDDEAAVRAALATEYEPLVGVVVDGRLLALAHSSRRTGQACELGINTLPMARQRGYALAATAAWAALVADAGLAPIYSAFAENAASLALAAAAGYHPFARAAQVSHARDQV
ncbi:MAG TPA: GNAT family N-acetyltransferase [Ktedonobacterales bacterium]|nr:GNAT family N-acetyltransferase [Ktedonobacterales bacterium]